MSLGTLIAGFLLRMRRTRIRLSNAVLSLWLGFLLGLQVLWAEDFRDHLSVSEFRALAAELSHKVNIFEAVWRTDPSAEFFGGTTRDYLYWLRGQFRQTVTKDQVVAKIAELRKAKSIDARTFIIGDSDVDIVSTQYDLKRFASIFGVKKIDLIGRQRFNAQSLEGQNELKQGYIPVEKIRLNRDGFIDWPGFGNGLLEIYHARPTVHFASAEDFRKTYFVAQGLNHSSLLALRFIRILGVNYFYQFGDAYPNEAKLLDIDSESARQTQAVIQAALKDWELRKLMFNRKFREWMVGVLHKTFRATTNRTAAKLLHEHFRVDALISRFSRSLGQTNHYLFSREPLDPAILSSRLQKFGFTYAQVFTPTQELFPDLKFYHGVRKGLKAFRSIALHGALPSSSGSAGQGLYGVEAKNINFAKKWASSKDLVIEATVDVNAKIIDITKGAGRELWNAWRRKRRKHGRTFDDFANHFGVDILRYPYRPNAYVVKNAAALTAINDPSKRVLSFQQLMEMAEQPETREKAFFAALSSKADFTQRELEIIQESLIKPLIFEWARLPMNLSDALTFFDTYGPVHLNTTEQVDLAKLLKLKDLIEIEAKGSGSLSDTLSMLYRPVWQLLPQDISAPAIQKLLIPKLTEQVGWSDLQQLFDVLLKFSLSSEEQISVVKAIGLKELHEDPYAVVVRRLLEGSFNLIPDTLHPLHSSKKDAERLLFAIALHSYLRTSFASQQNPKLLESSAMRLNYKMEALFEGLTTWDKNFNERHSLIENLYKLMKISGYDSHSYVNRQLLYTLEELTKWRRTKGSWKAYSEQALFRIGVAISVSMALLTAALAASPVKEGVWVLGYTGIAVSAAAFLGSIPRLIAHRNVAKKHMAHLAKALAEKKGLPCSKHILRLSKDF